MIWGLSQTSIHSSLEDVLANKIEISGNFHFLNIFLHIFMFTWVVGGLMWAPKSLKNPRKRRLGEYIWFKKNEWKIGTEHEKFLYDVDNFKPIKYNGKKSIISLFNEFQKNGWEKILENNQPVALKRSGSTISLEPRCQIELSGAPVKTLHQTCMQAKKYLDEFKYSLIIIFIDVCGRYSSSNIAACNKTINNFSVLFSLKSLLRCSCIVSSISSFLSNVPKTTSLINFLYLCFGKDISESLFK